MLPNLTVMMQPSRSGLCISLETKVPAENFTSLEQRESARLVEPARKGDALLDSSVGAPLAELED